MISLPAYARRARAFRLSCIASAITVLLAACGGGGGVDEPGPSPATDEQVISMPAVEPEEVALTVDKTEATSGRLAWSESDPGDLVPFSSTDIGKVGGECVGYIKDWRLPGSTRAGLIAETWGGHGDQTDTRINASHKAGLRTGTTPRRGALAHFYLSSANCGGVAGGCTHSLVIEKVTPRFITTGTMEFTVEVAESNYDSANIIGTRTVRLIMAAGARGAKDSNGQPWYFSYTPQSREQALDVQANAVINGWLSAGLLSPDSLTSAAKADLVLSLRLVQSEADLNAWDSAMRAVVKNLGLPIRHEIATGLLPAAAAGASSSWLATRIDAAVRASPQPLPSSPPPATSTPSFRSISAPSSASIGQTASIRVEAYDRDGNLRSVAIRWSDGRSAETRSADGSTETETFTRSFLNGGQVSWAVTITDSTGRAATRTGTVLVQVPVPTAPDVSSIYPTSPVANGKAVQVSLYGGNFHPRATVRFKAPSGTWMTCCAAGAPAVQSSRLIGVRPNFGRETGTWTVEVRNPDGQKDTRNFRVVAP